MQVSVRLYFETSPAIETNAQRHDLLVQGRATQAQAFRRFHHIAGTLRQGPSDQVALEGFAGLLEIPDRPVVRRSRQLRQRLQGPSAAPRAAASSNRWSASSSARSSTLRSSRTLPGQACRASSARASSPSSWRRPWSRLSRIDSQSAGRSSGAGATAGSRSAGRSAGSRGQRGNGLRASPAAGRWKWRRPGGCRCGSLRWNPQLRTLSPVARATACLARPAACRRSRRGTTCRPGPPATCLAGPCARHR